MPDEMELQELRIHERMSKIDHKIIVMSGKGGVGKSTVTVNLANALLEKGFKVGVLDTDIHGPNIAKMFGCEGEVLGSNEDGSVIIPVSPMPNLKVVSLSFALKDQEQAIIFRGPMKISVIKQFLADVEWGTLDYLLIDSPPGTGDEQLAVCQTIPNMTGSIIVTTPQKVSILDVRRSITFSRQLDVEIIGLIENMSYLICPHCNKRIPIFGKDGGKLVCQEMDVHFLGAIPMEIGLQQDEDEGVNWIKANPGSESAKAFKEIATYIHENTKVIHSPFVPKLSSCSPSSCASCTANCPSKGSSSNE